MWVWISVTERKGDFQISRFVDVNPAAHFALESRKAHASNSSSGCGDGVDVLGFWLAGVLASAVRTERLK